MLCQLVTYAASVTFKKTRLHHQFKVYVRLSLILWNAQSLSFAWLPNWTDIVFSNTTVNNLGVESNIYLGCLFMFNKYFSISREQKNPPKMTNKKTPAGNLFTATFSKQVATISHQSHQWSACRDLRPQNGKVPLYNMKLVSILSNICNLLGSLSNFFRFMVT